jgi:hypothetical protein
MTAAAAIDHHQSPRPDLLEIFRMRCEARAHLCAAGLHTVQGSVDTLQQAAERYGLVRKLGQDRVQEIMAEAFARWSV